MKPSKDFFPSESRDCASEINICPFVARPSISSAVLIIEFFNRLSLINSWAETIILFKFHVISSPRLKYFSIGIGSIPLTISPFLIRGRAVGGAGRISTYFSPIRPKLRIKTWESCPNFTSFFNHNLTRTSGFSFSYTILISFTSPTLTPLTLTGPPVSNPPTKLKETPIP